jgi:hypothetical protein
MWKLSDAAPALIAEVEALRAALVEMAATEPCSSGYWFRQTARDALAMTDKEEANAE